MDIIDLENLETLNEGDLNRLMLLVQGEIVSRKVINSKVRSLEFSGDSQLPVFENNEFVLIKDGILWCKGIKIQSSKLSHKCIFVSIAGKWCWDSELKMEDNMQFSSEPKPTVHTLTQVLLVEGTEIDVVSCSASGSTHKVKKIESYVVTNSGLTPTGSRKIKFENHR